MELDTDEITGAIETLRAAFDADSGLKLAYTANIAGLLWDRYGMDNYKERHQAAEDILKFILHYDMTILFGGRHEE